MSTSTCCGTNLNARAHVMPDAHKRWIHRETRQRLAEHPGRAEVSERTNAHRVDSIARIYADLWVIGYRIERVESLAPRHLVVEFHEVVHSRNPRHGRLVTNSRVWSMPAVVMDEGLQRGLSQAEDR